MYSVRVRRVVVIMGYRVYHKMGGVPKALSEEGMSRSDHIGRVLITPKTNYIVPVPYLCLSITSRDILNTAAVWRDQYPTRTEHS
jgi:hypothetical protein